MRSLWLDDPGTSDIETDTWEEGAAYDVVVAGAGITGLTTALLLARQGRRVAVLEARRVSAVTTGNTTGKVSLLQGTSLSSIVKAAGPEVARHYVRANTCAQEWVLERCSGTGIAQVRDAYTYAVTAAGKRKVAKELDACAGVGLPVEAVQSDQTGLPYPVRAAVRLADQVQIHPVQLMHSLVAELRELGAAVIEGVRVTGVAADDPVTLRTDQGEITARHVVLATGAPVLDRGLHFARLEAQRSYAMAYRVPGAIPAGMYLSADQTTRSLRTAPHGVGEVLIAGGNGHGVARHPSPASQVEDLHRWVQENFSGAERTHTWSAQDYSTTDSVPLVGPLPGTHERVLVATGYNKWGMTNGVAAAMALAGRVSGDLPAWAETYAGRGPGASRALATARFNAAAGAYMSAGWALAELRSLPARPPAEGAGAVGREGVRPTAVSTVDGQTRTVSAICTHLGGVLRWNDAECTWDCPLHGSRFTAAGELLEGPATRDLPSG